MAILQPLYDGLFTVMTRDDKNFTIRVHSKNITVLIDRVKAAYLFTESLTDVSEITNNQQQDNQTHSMATQAHDQDEPAIESKMRAHRFLRIKEE